jgi:hypothetical protein
VIGGQELILISKMILAELTGNVRVTSVERRSSNPLSIVSDQESVLISEE